jgi:hypothetical protein
LPTSSSSVRWLATNLYSKIPFSNKTFLPGINTLFARGGLENSDP